jgi:phage terminase small subunit
MVRKYGPVMRSKGTYIQQSPYLSIANKARASMMKILVEFGATPASRSRIDVSALDEEVFR